MSNKYLLTVGPATVLILTENNEIFGFGSNKSGQINWLYDGVDFYNSPIQIRHDLLTFERNDSVTVIASRQMSYVLVNSTLLAWAGSIGVVNSFLYTSLPKFAEPAILTKTPIKKILSYAHTIILTEENYLFGCGSNAYSQFSLDPDQGYRLMPMFMGNGEKYHDFHISP
jgi:alpha-tubulin suppressor-like RCC1 family protein